MSDPLELELVGVEAGNRTWVLWNSSTYSEPLNYLSSPRNWHFRELKIKCILGGVMMNEQRQENSGESQDLGPSCHAAGNTDGAYAAESLEKAPPIYEFLVTGFFCCCCSVLEFCFRREGQLQKSLSFLCSQRFPI